MSLHKTCRFCKIIIGEYFYEGVDEPFATNDEFVAIASVGALVEGWTLIVPKAHDLSMKNNYSNPVLSDFLDSVLPPLNRRYGPLIAFEHGANAEDSDTACGTAHAHLHIVPFGGTLLPDLQESEMKWINCRASEISLMAGEHEYLFYIELGLVESWSDPFGHLHILKKPKSQFFRYLVAKRSGLSDDYDYRNFPRLNTSRQTRSVLANSF